MTDTPVPRSAETNTYKCSWRTISTKPELNGKGEITVEARSLIDAIDVAKYKIHVQTRFGVNNIVVYEVEESFL
jgi:hypothetical protein